jgi:hypothetical protein
MTLAAGEERALARIEGALRRSDPKLAAMLSTFNRLTRSEEMPRREFLFGSRPLRWPPAHAGPWLDRWRPVPPLPSGESPGHQARRLSRPERPPRYGRPSRLAGILPLVVVTFALALVIAVFAALSHTRSAGVVPDTGTSCATQSTAGCQPPAGQTVPGQTVPGATRHGPATGSGAKYTVPPGP